MFRGTEGIGPILSIKVGKLAEVCRNSVEPFVEYHMKLCGHSPGVWIENEGYATSMFFKIVWILIVLRIGIFYRIF